MKKGDRVRIKASSMHYDFEGLLKNKTYEINDVIHQDGELKGIRFKNVEMEDGDYYLPRHWEPCKELNIKKILKYYEENS